MLTFNIVGAGRLGKTLGRLLVDLPAYELKGVFNRTLSSGVEACDDIGAGDAMDSLHLLPKAKVLLIATSDGEIESVVNQLLAAEVDLFGTVVVHFSGALNSDVLAPLRERGASVASCHPMRSFSSAKISRTQFFGTKCALEGDRNALTIMSTLLEELGAHFFLIDKEKKVLYHAAGVMGSNYMIALAEAAEQSLQAAGINDRSLQKAIVSSLMEGTLDNYRRTDSTTEALTGPVARGDGETIERHQKAIRKELPNVSGLYRTLANFLLANVATLPEGKKEELAALLQQTVATSTEEEMMVTMNP